MTAGPGCSPRLQAMTKPHSSSGPSSGTRSAAGLQLVPDGDLGHDREPEPRLHAALDRLQAERLQAPGGLDAGAGEQRSSSPPVDGALIAHHQHVLAEVG